MKRSSSADRAPRPEEILPFNNVKPARPTLARSASLGRDVRCGCQFFGTDSLLPERQALMLLGRPKAKSTMSSPKPLRSQVIIAGAIKRQNIVKSSRSFSVGDHEYEPVSMPPPPPCVRVTGPGYDRYEPELGNAPREGSNSSTESRERKERKFLRIPLDDEMQGLPADGEGSEDEALGVEEKEEKDDRAAAVPSPGTTTGSRTDLELNTSQVDSSALEDLPLSRSARRQQRMEQNEERGPGAAARSLQRIRSQAGKLRTKLRSIKRPHITMPETPRWSMPAMPAMPTMPTMPDRPRFNPKFPKFPEREFPKFSLPSRPKFMSERPKFMSERPKFMSERPKFNMPSFSLPRNSFRRPLREKQQGAADDTSEDANVHDDTPVPSTANKRNYFDFRTYPRIFDRKSRQQREVSTSVPVRSARHRHVTPPVMNYGDDDDEMEIEEDDSPVPRPKLPPRRRSSGGQQPPRWVGRFTELEYADTENMGPPPRTNGSSMPFDDEDEDEIRALERELHAHGNSDVEDRSESISGFRDKDFGYAVSMGAVRAPPPPMLDKDEEEISLGESEREVAHSSGSSSDRRRAGVLEEIDSDEFFLREKGLSQEDVAVGEYLSSEIREAFRPAPEANAALLLENATLNEAELARSYRGTPERTGTNNRTRPPRRTRAARQRGGSPAPPSSQQEPEEPGDTQQYFNTFPPNKPTRNRRRQLRQQQQQERQRQEKAATLGRPVGPQAPKRKKRTRSEFVLDNASQWSEEQDVNPPEWLKDVESQVVAHQMFTEPRSRPEKEEHEYIIPEAPAAPAAPKRGRRTSRRTPDEDARSHISEQPDPGYATVIRPGVIEIEIVDSQQHQGAPCTPPPRRVKTLPRPPFPSIRRRRSRPVSGSGTAHFFTVPHRRSHYGPPTRPSRNYSTLGPARPPRKQRRASLEDLQDAGRNLQSGAVIQKMKERPLPAPPRPPRREREAGPLDDIATAEEMAQDSQPAECEPERETQVFSTSDVPAAEETHSESAAPEEEMVEENVVIHKMELASDVIHTEQKVVPGSIMEQIRSRHITAAISEPEVERVTESQPEPAVQVQAAETPIVKEEIIVESRAPPQISGEIFPEASLAEIEDAWPAAPTSEPMSVIEQQIEVIERPAVQETLSHIETSHVEARIQTTEAAPEEFIPEPVKEEILTESVSTQASITSTEVATSPEEAYVPVEEVSVSTQTDPLPEEELMRLEMEQVEMEEAACGPCTPEPAVCVPPPTLSQPSVTAPAATLELSPATAALLQALNSGQLRLELLDVARLNVNELQAQRLLVSDIEGLSLNVGDLQSRGGALVLSTLDAPMGSLAEALITAAQQIAPPAPPPAPAAPEPTFVAATSRPVEASAPPQQAITSSETYPMEMSSMSERAPAESAHESTPLSELIPISAEASAESAFSEAMDTTSNQSFATRASPQPSTSRASPLPASSAPFYHSLSPVFTTEQVVALQAAALSNVRDREPSLPPPLPPRRPSAPPTDLWQMPGAHQQQEVEPGIAELGSRLARACCTATLGALRRVVTYAELQNTGNAEQTRERSGLQVALCIVLVLVAGLILIGLGSSGAGAVHHHHWDFYMPQ